MVDLAALILPGTFLGSLGPLIDAFVITQERGERTIGAETGGLANVRLTLLSADGRDVPVGRHGPLRIDRSIADDDRFDFIWIPAFRAYGEAGLRERLAANRRIIDWLRQVADNGTIIGASGAAVILPMAAHLTGDWPIPVARPLLPLVRALFPRFRHGPDLAIADHHNILLSRGIGQDVQAITALFSRLFSPESGRWLRSIFGSETVQDDTLIDGEARDSLVATARMILEQRFATTVSISALAAELCVSHTVLTRRFQRELCTTPSRYVQQLRLRAAQRMLLHTDSPVDRVAAAVGYSDARMFREMFRKATGIGASEWRRTERARTGPQSASSKSPATPRH